jgi:hypothetical protein
LKLSSGILVSKFAFKCNLYCYRAAHPVQRQQRQHHQVLVPQPAGGGAAGHLGAHGTRGDGGGGDGGGDDGRRRRRRRRGRRCGWGRGRGRKRLPPRGVERRRPSRRRRHPRHGSRRRRRQKRTAAARPAPGVTPQHPSRHAPPGPAPRRRGGSRRSWRRWCTRYSRYSRYLCGETRASASAWQTLGAGGWATGRGRGWGWCSNGNGYAGSASRPGKTTTPWTTWARRAGRGSSRSEIERGWFTIEGELREHLRGGGPAEEEF